MYEPPWETAEAFLWPETYWLGEWEREGKTEDKSSLTLARRRGCCLATTPKENRPELQLMWGGLPGSLPKSIPRRDA